MEQYKDKHYRLPADVTEYLNARNPSCYRTETDYLIQIIRDHERISGLGNDYISSLNKLHAKIEELCELMRMNIRVDAANGKYHSQFPGGLEDLENYINSIYQLEQEKHALL